MDTTKGRSEEQREMMQLSKRGVLGSAHLHCGYLRRPGFHWIPCVRRPVLVTCSLVLTLLPLFLTQELVYQSAEGAQSGSF